MRTEQTRPRPAAGRKLLRCILAFIILTGTSWAAEPARLRGLILDASTGTPTPCTVTITDANGRVLTERASFSAGFRCAGHFDQLLPAGRTRIRVTRGFETRAIEQELELPAGGEADVEFRLERVVDLRQRGWYAGDSHAHMIHGERTIPVDFDFVALTARAEDLQYLSLSHAWAMADPTPEKLAAELERRSTSECVLTWNLEAPKNYYRGDAGRCLGHCWTVGMAGRTPAGRSVIELLLAASAADYESTKPVHANFESHQLVHAQGGKVFYTHPARWWMGAWGGQGGYPRQERMRISNLAVELPLDTLIGPTYDGLDIITSAGELSANAKAFDLWALLLNHGYRLAATASSDACFDRPGGAVPGAARVYTFINNPFSLAAAANALAAGRTFVTTGPLLLASVDGLPPGSAFASAGQPRALQIEAWASGQDPAGLRRVELLRNGTLLHAWELTPPQSAFHTNLTLRENTAAWFCLRAFGGEPRTQRAVTGAFFLDPKPHLPPAPVPARVRARITDAATGQLIAGIIREVRLLGPEPQPGTTHSLPDGKRRLAVPATVRLQAEAPGYQPLILSPVLDHPPLVETVTRLTDEDLLRWETFERLRTLLADIPLTFALQRSSERN